MSPGLTVVCSSSTCTQFIQQRCSIYKRHHRSLMVFRGFASSRDRVSIKRSLRLRGYFFLPPLPSSPFPVAPPRTSFAGRGSRRSEPPSIRYADRRFTSSARLNFNYVGRRGSVNLTRAMIHRGAKGIFKPAVKTRQTRGGVSKNLLVR